MTLPRRMNTPCDVPWKEFSYESRQQGQNLYFWLEHIGQSILIVLQ